MLTTVTRYCAVVVAIVPGLALAGWLLDSALLRELGPGGKPMNPLAALALLASAASLYLLTRPTPAARRAARALAGAVALTGALRLLDLATGNRWRVDLALFGDLLHDYPTDPQLTLIAAVCFGLVGLALAFYQVRPVRVLTVPVVLLALYVIAGYLLGGQAFLHIAQFKPMAFNAAAAFILLSAGLAALPPAVPPISSMALPGAAGATARRLLPAVLIIPMVLGWLRIEGERSGWFDMGFGTAAFSTLTAVALALLVLLSVAVLQRTEAAQQESERRIFRLLDGLPTAVFVVDADGHPYYTNRKSHEILGRGTLPEAGLEHLSERYQAYVAGTSQPYPPERTAVARALHGETTYTTDVEIHRPDRVVPLEVWGTPIRNGNGEIEFAVAAFNDITERLQMLAELEAVNKELETFSYSVSHDLRAPLRAVDGFSQALETDHAGALDPEALRYLGRIRGNTRRMGALIDDLLRFSRLSRKELETREVDMTALVRNVVDDLSRSRPSSARITVGDLPVADGDLDLLRQVWINLVDNAIKYSARRPDPVVEISGRRDGAEVTYTVRDNGEGFDMAYADKLFGVFQRLHRQDEFEGTGVGLAIVQRIVHRHGGRVWAEAAPGKGAAFHLTLAAGGEHGGR